MSTYQLFVSSRIFRAGMTAGLLVWGASACSGEGDEPNTDMGSGGTAASAGGAMSSSGGAAAMASGGSSTVASGGAATVGAGGAAAGGASTGSGGETMGSGGAMDASGGAPALETYASDLHELFIDAACSSDTTGPLGNGDTCGHLNDAWSIEKKVTFGGEPGTNYLVTLRVRGIWEPTDIDGGDAPYMGVPFMVGGDVKGGSGMSSDAINYQQYFIRVASPMQTYWLNNHDYLAHDIHKVDYEATIEVEGGSEIDVVMNDGNERQIANWTKDIFDDMPPYDQSPTLGQLLQLEVIKVELAQ